MHNAQNLILAYISEWMDANVVESLQPLKAENATKWNVNAINHGAPRRSQNAKICAEY